MGDPAAKIRAANEALMTEMGNLRKVIELRGRLSRIASLHGDGEQCEICGMDWECETWRIAVGKEDTNG